MNQSRLLVLGVLSLSGPAHGHEIRRTARMVNVEAWSGVRVGSVYNAINRLAAEGLIEAVRTEREGRLPARTVYAITEAGERELVALRHQALTRLEFGNDPFGLGLWLASALPRDELAETVRARAEQLRELRDSVVTRREQLRTRGLPPVGQALMRHAELFLDAELRWHAELLEDLPTLFDAE